MADALNSIFSQSAGEAQTGDAQGHAELAAAFNKAGAFLQKHATKLAENPTYLQESTQLVDASYVGNDGVASWRQGMPDSWLFGIAFCFVAWVILYYGYLIKYGLLGLYFEKEGERSEPFYWAIPTNPADFGKPRDANGRIIGGDNGNAPYHAMDDGDKKKNTWFA